ncbi:hypothetical protein [Nonomuraea sp. NPDC003804]|uniref:hypothetical protein n=1 Tax=Nonomuraea sp. NPDC003804 TaxID=3154547 RepID=UPI0033ADF06B
MADDVVMEILDWHRETARDGLAGDGVRFVEPFGAWVVHGYTEVNQVLTDYSMFSSDELRYSSQPVPHRDNPVLGGLSAMDPPRHHLLRRLVSRAFTLLHAAAHQRPRDDQDPAGQHRAVPGGSPGRTGPAAG